MTTASRSFVNFMVAEGTLKRFWLKSSVLPKKFVFFRFSLSPSRLQILPLAYVLCICKGPCP